MGFMAGYHIRMIRAQGLLPDCKRTLNSGSALVHAELHLSQYQCCRSFFALISCYTRSSSNCSQAMSINACDNAVADTSGCALFYRCWRLLEGPYSPVVMRQVLAAVEKMPEP